MSYLASFKSEHGEVETETGHAEDVRYSKIFPHEETLMRHVYHVAKRSRFNPILLFNSQTCSKLVLNFLARLAV